MDFSKYDSETRELMKNCEHLSASGDPEAIVSLDRLRGMAEAAGDNALIGYADYYAANWYYDRPDYEKYRERLKSAIYYLLRSDDMEYLSRAYNIFAMDAEENEAFDVAYHYYQNALKFADEENYPGVNGVVVSNLASLYYTVEDYDSAREYCRKGMQLFKDNTDNPYYQHNMLAGYINDSIFCLALEDYREAQLSYEQAGILFNEIDSEAFETVSVAYMLLELMVLLAMDEKAEFEAYLDDVIRILRKSEQPQKHVNMISVLCKTLFDYGRADCVGRLIEAVDEKVTELDITYASRILYELKVDYYDSMGDEKNLDASLREQHHFLMRQKEAQINIYKFSIELINLLFELQSEQTG